MKKLIFSLSIICLAIAGQAKDINEKAETTHENILTIQISGNVVDKTSKEALVGVEVKIDELNIKTYTDFDGMFSFKDLKPGEYNITASYISYEKNVIEIPVDNKDNNQISIKLESSN